MSLTPKKFYQELLTHDWGRIVACNILGGVDLNVISHGFAVELFDWWRTLLVWTREKKEPSASSTNLLTETFTQLIYNGKPPGFRQGTPKPDFLLSGSRTHPRNMNATHGFITVVDADMFLTHVVHSDEMRSLCGRGVTRFGPPTKADIQRLMRKGTVNVKLRTPASMGNLEKVHWIAPEHHEDQSLATSFATYASVLGRTPADYARDLLGLMHYKEKTGLLALHIPVAAVRSMLHARPTVVDAGGHERFKAYPDLPSNLAQPAWGYTTDLDKLATNALHLDGWPERVTEPIPTTALSPLAITPLGFVTTTRGETATDNDCVFADRICKRYGTKRKLLRHLMRLS